ncbi:BMP family ABC transporter substrate-binding protein [Streptomyces sp. NBC_01471]|uniref:BMP family ABC transporter substrate-binding protein n=1 Tax=Streptomyces sp. NBC_01471 TaxID=2903879 RepID=UPI00324EA5C3
MNVKEALFGTRQRVLLSSGAVVVAATAAMVALMAGGGGAHEIPPSRARAYSQQQACLLTPANGLADSAVTQVWEGMQDASALTKAKVSYLAVTGPQNAANAAPYLASLVSRQCTVVVTVGAAPDGAATRDAKRFPKTRFLLTGTHSQGSGSANLTNAENTRAAIASAVTAAVRD